MGGRSSVLKSQYPLQSQVSFSEVTGQEKKEKVCLCRCVYRGETVDLRGELIQLRVVEDRRQPGLLRDPSEAGKEV